MTGDVCPCGICEIDACDLCAAPVAFVDEDGEAWCRSCWLAYLERVQERANLRWFSGGYE